MFSWTLQMITIVAQSTYRTNLFSILWLLTQKLQLICLCLWIFLFVPLIQHLIYFFFHFTVVFLAFNWVLVASQVWHMSMHCCSVSFDCYSILVTTLTSDKITSTSLYFSPKIGSEQQCKLCIKDKFK